MLRELYKPPLQEILLYSGKFFTQIGKNDSCLRIAEQRVYGESGLNFDFRNVLLKMPSSDCGCSRREIYRDSTASQEEILQQKNRTSVVIKHE